MPLAFKDDPDVREFVLDGEGYEGGFPAVVYVDLIEQAWTRSLSTAFRSFFLMIERVTTLGHS